jgi:transformer-2 protein
VFRRGGGGRSHSRSPMRRRNAGPRGSSFNQGGGGGSQEARGFSSRSSRVLQDDPQPNKCLGVFGLSLRTTERDLKEVFSRYGPIDECTVVIDAQVRRSRSR